MLLVMCMAVVVCYTNLNAFGVLYRGDVSFGGWCLQCSEHRVELSVAFSAFYVSANVSYTYHAMPFSDWGNHNFLLGIAVIQLRCLCLCGGGEVCALCWYRTYTYGVG